MQPYYTNSSSNSLFFNYKDSKNLSNSLWKTKKKELGTENINFIYVNPKLEQIIRSKRECYGQKKSFTDHYLYFFSTVWYLSNVDRRYQEDEYVKINYKTLTSVISRDIYPVILKNSIRWNIIKENPDKKYKTGWFSKSFRLKEPFDTNVKKIPVEDRLINRKINQHRRKHQREVEKYPQSYQYLKTTNTFIQMDVASATQYNQIHYQIQQPHKYDANFYSISEYTDRNYRFTVDAFGNRAHTNLTNLSADFRQFLTVDGEPLGQVDISNSQPLFFYLHLQNISSIPQWEKDRYQAIVEGGKFYEFFMEKLSIPAKKRQDVKHKILAAVFFDKHRNKESRYIKIFKQELPHIAVYIEMLKKRDHRQIAKLLQRAESKFIIERVVAEFIKEFSGKEFIATIHDSLVVKNSVLNAAKEIIIKCSRAEGINPKLKTETWNQPTPAYPP